MDNFITYLKHKHCTAFEKVPTLDPINNLPKILSQCILLKRIKESLCGGLKYYKKYSVYCELALGFFQDLFSFFESSFYSKTCNIQEAIILLRNVIGKVWNWTLKWGKLGGRTYTPPLCKYGPLMAVQGEEMYALSIRIKEMLKVE